MRLSIPPDEAESPLIIDANAVLTHPIPLQRFQPVTRRDPEVIQPPSRVKIQQFASRHSLERSKPGDVAIAKQSFCFAALK
jgi:hypothetical protein